MAEEVVESVSTPEDFTFSFSVDDLTQGKATTPGWYKGRVLSVEKKFASDKISTNYIIHFELQIKNEDGTPGKRKRFRLFNSKGMGFAEPFIVACNDGKPVKVGQQYNFQSSIGKEMDVYVANRLYNDRLVDDLKDFRPIK